ncbi:Rv3212 family protein [Nocardia paucivorans]|uniref:Rv3212 family protein n=1 Tax=Nocardia paucivorans TaxID=114259 RepID=UPI00030A538F|nr:PQQ-binding-like beta-propeller repeat protein [Nocardia paucivorans]
MLAPERRTRADVIAAAAIAVVLVIAAVSAWACSDARGAESITATESVTRPPNADRLPTRPKELWRAPDTADDRVLTSEGVVVTADGGTVTGRDPGTGAQVWRYRRDLPLCGVESQFGMVIAVYRDDRGCSQTTMLSGQDGRRRTARSSHMDDTIRLSTDGTYVLALGPRRLEMWRSDLVRTLEYGYVDARVNPKTQPRQGCSLISAASSPSRLAVLERCPNEPANRLTVLDPAPEDNTVPEEFGTHVLEEPDADSPDARVLAVSDTRIVLYLPGVEGPKPQAPRLKVLDATGNSLVVHELSAPLTASATTTRIGSGYFVFTGNSVIALHAGTFDPMWTAPHALGGPALMAGRLLVPVPDAIAALDPSTGAVTTRIPVSRKDHDGSPISIGVLGTTIFEQRGGELVALG